MWRHISHIFPPPLVTQRYKCPIPSTPKCVTSFMDFPIGLNSDRSKLIGLSLDGINKPMFRRLFIGLSFDGSIEVKI